MGKTSTGVEFTGSDFLMWATDEEMEAVRAVQLFFDLARLVERNAGSEGFNINRTRLHRFFPDFAKLYWPHNVYMQSAKRRCLAVELHDRATGPRRGEVLSHMFYLGDMPDPPLEREYLEAATKNAVDCGLINPDTNRALLLENAAITLRDILDRAT